VGREDNFFELGGDSILSIQVVARAGQAGLRMSPRQMFEQQTVAELALVVGGEEQIEAEQGIVKGGLPLLPIQRRFFELVTVEPHHYNQAIFLETTEKPDGERLEAIISHLLAHHDALRLRFRKESEGWKQWITEGEDVARVLLRKDMSNISDEELSRHLEEEATRCQTSLNLREGPLVRVVWFECGDGRADRLLWIIHHLAVDGVSWRILMEDLGRLWSSPIEQMGAVLPAKTTSYKRWAEELIEYVQKGLSREEREYWEKTSKKTGRVRVIHAEEEIEEKTESVQVLLSVDETQAMLQEVPAVYRTQINDVLLTALMKVFAEWNGDRQLLIDLEGHGREDVLKDVDVSRTVGWFTSLYPVVLQLPESGDVGDQLKSIKEQLRRVPGRGFGYGLLRYVSEEDSGRALQESPQAEICFNYLGQFDQVLNTQPVFRRARERVGPLWSNGNRRTHLLDLNGSIGGGRLGFRWSYSKKQYTEETVTHLADRYMMALKEIIEHCRSSHSVGYTPSDFPLINLDQQTIDRLADNSRSMEKL